MTAAPLHTIQIGKGWFPEDAGGLERFYYDLMQHLPGTGVSVDGMVIGSGCVEAQSHGAIHAFAPAGAGLLARWRGVRNQFARSLSARPDSLIVGHFALYAAPCLDLIGDRPLVMHFQGPWAAESRAEGASLLAARIKHRVERYVYDRTARSIVLSRAFAALLHEHHGVAADRIDVIPGAVDCDRWDCGLTRAVAREQLGWPADRPIVLVVRRLVRRMGLEGLVRAIPAIRRAVPDALVIVAGRGPLTGELEALRSAIGVEENLSFAGFVPDDQLARAYRAADLTVVPSVSLEGFGLVVAESLAAGTPVLVTAVGGLPETVEKLSAACIIDGHDSESISRTIANALLGQLPLPDAAECVRHVRAHFDWPVVAAQVSAAYRQAAA